MQSRIKKILIVDDETSIRNLLSKILSSSNYEAVTASNGREGLELYKKENPDLVITDIVMPDMEGIELIRHLRKIDRNLPVIVMSGNPTGQQFLKTANLLGAHSTLLKPFSPSELLSIITSVENS